MTDWDYHQPPTAGELARLKMLMDDDAILWQCPYCGARDVAGHRLHEHPEMWIGGSNTWGSDLHGWADH